MFYANVLYKLTFHLLTYCNKDGVRDDVILQVQSSTRDHITSLFWTSSAEWSKVPSTSLPLRVNYTRRWTRTHTWPSRSRKFCRISWDK